MAPPIRGVSTGIKQLITATNDFDGQLPSTTPAYDAATRLETFPTDTQGGLFDFEQTEPIVVTGVDLKLGGQTTWTLSRVHSDASEVVWLVSVPPPETSVVVGGSDEQLRLLPGQKLKLVTTNATAALEATVMVRAESEEA